MDKIFASLSSFRFANPDGNFTGPHLGVRVACLELQENIIKYGGFDCYHFLLGRGDHREEDVTKYINSRNWDRQKILIYDGPLPLDRLKTSRYHVLHKPDLSLTDIFALRRAVASPLAPAAVLNHSLSYSSFMPMWLELRLSHVLPCDAVVCTSRASRDVIEKSLGLWSERLSTQLGVALPPFQGRLEIIPLGVDVEYWRPEPDNAQAKKSLGLPEKPCLILCPARFSTHDKMDLRPFLIAVQRLLGIVGPGSFQVILAGDERAEGESKLIQEFVDKLGVSHVVRLDTNGDPSRIRQYYRAADVFVSLVDNIQETFGLTVTQAMACGLPAVVSDWNGYKDTVVHGETGFRVHTYWAECDSQISSLGQQRSWMMDHLLLAQSVCVDTDEMLSVLHRLTIDPGLRHHWGQAGRKRAEELYAWPVVVKRYRELWDECHERFAYVDPEQWLREDHAALFAPQYFRQFSHYPSEIIAPGTKLALVAAGAALASAANLPAEVLLPPPMRPVFHPRIFQALLSRLADWPVTFGSLVTDVERETGLPGDLVARQIMWLMKYGVVKPVKTVKEFMAEITSAPALAETQRTHPVVVT